MNSGEGFKRDLALMNVNDFNGDGCSELFLGLYNDAYYLTHLEDKNNLLLTTLQDGMDVVESFTYEPISKLSVYKESAEKVNFPMLKVKFPLYLVFLMEKYAGAYREYTTYQYQDAMIHRQGKGFMGFKEIKETNILKNQTIKSKYGYNSSYYYPFLNERKLTTYSGSELSTTSFENAFTYISNNSIFPYVSKQTTTDHLKGTLQTSTFSNFEYGSPKTVQIKYGNDVTQTINTTYKNVNTGGKWILGQLPETIQKITSRAGSSWTDKLSFAYNDKHQLLKQTAFTNDGTKQVAENTYSYDGYGNIKTESTKAYTSPNLLTNSYEYSADGVFITKTTDPINLKTINTYNQLGQITTVYSDKNRGNTQYLYNTMGMLVKISSPDGSVSNISAAWNSSVYQGVYSITTSSTGAPSTIVHYDMLGRELRSSTIRFDAREQNVDTKYDQAGRLHQVSLPFFGNRASYWSTSLYDSNNRLASTTQASGNTSKYAYSNNTISTTKDGITSTQSFDAQGNMISSADPAGTITYNLRADGQFSNITSPGNISSSFGYDQYGRQTSITDPSAGFKTFVYDASGNISSETDANNRPKTFLYDAYNRLTKKTVPEMNTVYSYDAFGEIVSEVSSNGTSSTYGYDQLGRLIRVLEKGTGGRSLQKNYSYGQGNLSSVLYAANGGLITSEHYQYQNGHLNQIKLSDGSIIWNLNA
ncbi:hypothetical protein AwDysgo_21740 [Bacteroidales bacterium]|nr:hypothetical protein AwDysgo_21740 [Bacteroidales bacterium]